MPDISLSLVDIGSLGPGLSKTLSVPNAPAQRVWAFSVEPREVPDGDTLVGTPAFEITKVSHELIGPVGPGNRRVRVTIKNTSSNMNIPWGYRLYMARIKDDLALPPL